MPFLSYFFTHIYEIVLEAIFPLTASERALLSISTLDIWRIFPRALRSSIPEACSIFAYKNKQVSTLVWSLKYKKSAHATKIGGYALYEILKTFMNAITYDGVGNRQTLQILLVPIPISKRRRRERGFNQCDLLVDEIKKLYLNNAQISGLNQNLNQNLLFSKKLLVRTHHNSRQTLKDRRERLEGAQKIFSANLMELDQIRIKLNIIGSNSGKNYLILVIDDVVTTGSTMREAVQTLRDAGLTNTYGLALAH